MKLITVQTFDNPIDLALLKSKLESEGIKCFVFDEHTVTLQPLLSNGVGGIKLKINEADTDHALLILKDIQTQSRLDDQGESKTCPNCGCSDLYVNFKSMQGTKGVMSVLIMFFFVAFPFYYKNVFKCKKCNYEFK